jgi:hypothetical protein
MMQFRFSEISEILVYRGRIRWVTGDRGTFTDEDNLASNKADAFLP